MPTTVDRFFATVQIAQNLSSMQNNMRANAQGIKNAKDAGRIATFADAQKAMRDLGNAFLQRLSMNQTIYDQYPTQLQQGYAAIGILPADIGSIQNLLVQWATNMSTATITNQTQLDNGVQAILDNVPAAMIPF